MSLTSATPLEWRRRWRSVRRWQSPWHASARGPGRSLLVVAGVAAATGLLAGVLGGGLAARDRALQRSLAAASTAGTELPGQLLRPPLRQDLRAGRPGGPRRPCSRDAGTAGGPDAVPDAPDRPRAREPRRRSTTCAPLSASSRALAPACRPARCEVVQVGGGGARGSTRPGSTSFASVRPARGTALGVPGSGPPFLFAGSAAAFEHLPAFLGISRNHLWNAPLDPRSVHVWQVPRILAGESAAQALLAAARRDTYALTGADAALQAAQRDGRVSSQRMVLVAARSARSCSGSRSSPPSGSGAASGTRPGDCRSGRPARPGLAGGRDRGRAR